MAPDSKSAKIFTVVQFLERPYRDIGKYVCVPSSWILTNKLLICRAVVAYPREDPNVTTNRIENNEPPASMWPNFMALIKYESDDYDDADVWIKMEEKKISTDIITLDDDDEDDEMCEALIYRSDSDEDDDCNAERDILILKQEKLSEPEDIGVPDNVNGDENQEDADILLLKQYNSSEPEDINDTQSQDNAGIVIKSENIDIQDNNNAEDQHFINNLIIKEEPYYYADDSSESENIGTVNNFEEVENNGADGISEKDCIPRKSENIDIDDENFGNVGDNGADILASMEEEMPQSECDDDDDDLGLNDLIILEEKKVDLDDNMGNSIESTVMEQHIEYSTTSLNIQTIEQSLVETNTAPTPSITNTLQPSEIAHRPTISVVPEHFLRFGCHEQKQIPENTTHVGDKSKQALQFLTKTIYATETKTTQLIRKAQIHENTTAYVTGNYPHGEGHALSILRPNEVNHAVHTYDQNLSDNVSYPLEYTRAQHSGQQFGQPLAKSKPKKTPAKKMKPKAPTKKVQRYNQTHYHEQRGYTYISPQEPHVGSIQPQNIPMNTIPFEHSQLYRSNEQHLPVPVEQLTVDSTGSIIVRRTTGRNPLILHASKNNKRSIPKSAQHFAGTRNQFNHEFAPNYAGSIHTYPAQPGYLNQIPSHQAPQQNNPSVMGDYYNQTYSNSGNINANQFASDIGDCSVVQDPQSKLLYIRKMSEVQNYQQLPHTQNSYQAMLSTSGNVSSHFPDQLPVHHDTQLSNLQTQQNLQRGQILINQQTCDSHSTSQNNSLSIQGCPPCSCLQCASTSTFPPVDTRVSTSTDEQFSGLNDNNTENNVTAIQNQPKEIQEEQNSVDQNNTGPSENWSVVANESVPEPRLATADHQESPKQTSPVCSTGDKIEIPANKTQNTSNVTNELENVTAAIKAFELMLYKAEKIICKQTEAYKARHNKMFESDKEFKNIIESVISHCDSRINKILNSNNGLNNPHNRKRKVIKNSNK